MRQAIAIRLLFAFVDLSGLLASFVLAYTLRVYVFPFAAGATGASFAPYSQLFLLIGALWLCAAVEARVLGLHELPYEEEFVRLIRGVAIILGVVLLLLTMMKMNYEYSRLIIFGGFALSAVVMSINRVLLRAFLERMDGTQPTVLVVCAKRKLPQAVCRHLRLGASNHKMIGVVMPSEEIEEGTAGLDLGDMVLPIL